MSDFPRGNDWYAHGIMKRTHPEFGRFYYHSGYDGATSSVVCYFPDRGAAITVCINYNAKSSRLRAMHLLELIITEVFQP
jgi:hypothetical protein